MVSFRADTETTPHPDPSAMSPGMETIAAYVRELWPGRHNRTLAEALGVPRATVKAWFSGKRRMPIARMREMADVLRHDAPGADEPLAPLGNGGRGAIAPCHLDGVGLDLMAACLAPHYQPHVRCGCVPERHRRAGA
jgi:hypothetical protein